MSNFNSIITKKSSNQLLTVIILLLGVIPLIYWLHQHVMDDLWWDEIYSIKHFVAKEISQTLFYYPAPNNHILLNITSQIISHITNTRSLQAIAENVHLYRLFQAAIAIATFVYLILILKKMFNFNNITLVGVILFTTIPFLNYSLQLRGYNLSGLLLVIIAYYIWKFIEYPKNRNGIIIMLSSGLLVYTIPSNIYFIASILITLGFCWLVLAKSNDKGSIIFLKTVVLIGAGVIMALIMYLPIIHNVIFNRWSIKEAPYIFYSAEVAFKVLTAFISERYVLAIPFSIGLFYFLRTSKKEQKIKFLIFSSLLVLPFFLSLIHQRNPFERVFSPLAPIFCLCILVPIVYLLETVSSALIANIISTLISIYCIFTLIDNHQSNNLQIRNNLIENNSWTQNIYQNYYLSDSFNPKSVMTYLKKVSLDAPIFVYDQRDRHAINLYLRLNALNFEKSESIEQIEASVLANGEAYIVTGNLKGTLKTLEDSGNMNSYVLRSDYPFSSIIKVNVK